MRILGIDPGTATTGFGIVEFSPGSLPVLVDYGLISTSKDLSHGERLDLIYRGISEVITKYSPHEVSIERLFFARNVTTVISVGQAIGVIKLAIHHRSLPVFDYTPMQVKLVIGGSGKADKKVIKATVKKLLKIRGQNVSEIKDGLRTAKKGNKTHFDDAADALALAICHHRKIHDPKKV